MSSNAILIGQQSQSVQYGTLELDRLGPNDVLVASKAVGICRSDIELRDGHLDDQLKPPYPVVPGHEWAGEVLETGSAVKNVAAGDRVVGECVIADNHWFGFTLNGAGSDQFVVPSQLLHRLPTALSWTQGAMVEPFTIAYRAIHTSGGCDGGDIVVVVGAGMIGQSAVAAASAMGAFVVSLEPDPERRAMAEHFGADLTIDPTDGTNIRETITKATGQDGADLVLEASGHPAGLASTFELARHAGRITIIGICSAHSVSAPLGRIQSGDLMVRGVTGSPQVWPRALRFIDRHEIDLSPLVTKSFTFAQAVEAFSAAEDSTVNIKVHLQPC